MKNLLAILTLSLFSLNQSFGQAEVVKSFKVSERNSVDLKLTYAKDIKVKTWDKDEVEILAKVVLGKKETTKGFSLNVDKGGNKITVQSALDHDEIPYVKIEPDEDGNLDYGGSFSHISYNNGRWQAISYELEYEIKVPTYLAIDLCTQKGNVEVKGVNAPMEITTNRGFIDVARNPSEKAEVKLVTNSGEIFTDFDIDYDESKKKRNTCEAIKIEAAINGGGGDDISLTSTCGNIYLRKEK